jgi:two-component system capsular synthesis response regulator RcsB
MFEKVLVAEDQEMFNLSLRRTLEDLSIPRPDYAYYCDLTLAKLQKALTDGIPYDLLITDLFFETDDNPQQLPDGQSLIGAAKNLQPNLKILVFSAETRPVVIRSLYDELKIDGFVRKARGDAQELKAALERIAQHRRHYPRDYRAQSEQHNQHTFTEFDKLIVRLLYEGNTQKENPVYLKAHDIRPSALSSVEKHLNVMKTAMGYTKNEQLVVFCKEMGLI